jgi:hypothetical protein
MPSPTGEYGRLRVRFPDASVSFKRTTAEGSIQPLIAGQAGRRVHVQRIHVSITTTAAQTWTFQTSQTTPTVLGTIDASVPGSVTIDFGPDGYPVAEGEDLDLVISGAGAAGVGTVEAYWRQSSTLAASAL